jgi:hypothetical protein
VIEPNPNATPRLRGEDAGMWRGTLAGRMPIRSVWFGYATDPNYAHALMDMLASVQSLEKHMTRSGAA